MLLDPGQVLDEAEQARPGSYSGSPHLRVATELLFMRIDRDRGVRSLTVARAPEDRRK
jgi:hypothetical protein